MYTKSLIQQHLEMMDLLESFKSHINDIMNNVIIENSVFGINMKGNACEMMTGYFVEDKSFDSLDDCVKNIQKNQYIQILENKQFVTGYIHYSLMNCPHDKKILDLETLNYVR
jgi:hypothetical protein